MLSALTGCLGLVAEPVAQVNADDPAMSVAEARRSPLSADAAEALLRAELDLVFPKSVRRDGGFRAPVGPQPGDPVFGVQQARLTWLAAEVARRRADLRVDYNRYTEHGLNALADPLWDHTHGGWFWQLAPDQSTPTGPAETEKHLYGQVFGLYAAANAYRATGDPAARRLARLAFDWLETHARDTEHGGYFEVFTEDGQPITSYEQSAWAVSKNNRKRDQIGTPFGHKSMNAHIHALEALAALYLADPRPAVRERLIEVTHLVRDRIAQPAGGLAQVLSLDWQPVPGHRSYGHEVETAFLLIEADLALAKGDPAAQDPTTWRVAKRLVDDAIRDAMEPETGALLEDPHADRLARPWWGQVEMLNALLLMDAAYGRSTDRYRKTADRLWRFIAAELVDDRGRWITAAQPDGSWFGRRWYAAYHTGRSMIEVADRLRGLHPVQAPTAPNPEMSSPP